MMTHMLLLFLAGPTAALFIAFCTAQAAPASASLGSLRPPGRRHRVFRAAGAAGGPQLMPRPPGRAEFCPALLAVLLLVASQSPTLAQADAWTLLRQPGHVVFMRHAATPGGFGDPPGYRLDDCAS